MIYDVGREAYLFLLLSFDIQSLLHLLERQLSYGARIFRPSYTKTLYSLKKSVRVKLVLGSLKISGPSRMQLGRS
jgi:hypothetical protein